MLGNDFGEEIKVSNMTLVLIFKVCQHNTCCSFTTNPMDSGYSCDAAVCLCSGFKLLGFHLLF